MFWKIPRPYVCTVVAAAVTAIFAVDMTTPLGLGVPFLYLLVARFAISTRVGDRSLLAIACLTTALAALKLLAPPPVDGVVWFGTANRIIFSVLIWTGVGFELVRRRYEARIDANHRRFQQDLEGQVAARTAALNQVNRELEREIAERKQAEETVQGYAERLHSLAGQLVEAQEAERERLAAELHDRIGQNLTALNLSLNLQLAQLPAEGADTARARIRDALSLVERTAEVVRGVMEELHPALLDQYGLPAVLHWYGDEFSGRTGLEVVTEASDAFPRLEPKVEMTLFRIAQEALTNVAKHAGARRVVVALTRTEAGMALKVSDDGAGIDPDEARTRAAGRGWGLSIASERARAVGAEFTVDSAPGRGTRLVVYLRNELGEQKHDDDRTDRRRPRGGA